MKAPAKKDLYRKLPSVDELLHQPEIVALVEREGRAAVTEAARSVLETLRQEIASGSLDASRIELAVGGLAAAVERRLRQSLAPSLRPVINATGVILHTNLGRAPLAEAALERIREVAGVYSNLEFDIASGQRGKRDVHVERLTARLLNQEGLSGISTVVVNNNAAAVLLSLNTLAEGGEVIVSRGELVEIGGSFRIPDVMAKSGAVLREVGTTNRTRLADYEKAINERTRLLLRVHRSNFQIVGFTEQPSLEDLVALARKHKLRVLEDLGSGAMIDLRSVGVSGEPSVWDSLRAGVDVVTYSGDKLLGGPQAGLISGQSETVAGIRSNPLFRALRVDKLTYAALEATLLAYVRQDHNAIPALRMMRLSAEEIGRRAQALADALRAREGHVGPAAPPPQRANTGRAGDPGHGWAGEQSSHVPGLKVELIEGASVIGGGAAPAAALPTILLAITCQGLSADELAARLRAHRPPIVARVEQGKVLLDLRTVFPGQDEIIAEALSQCG